MSAVRIKIELNNIPKKIDRINNKALEAVTTQIAVDSNQFIPKDFGTLEASVFADSNFGKGEIVWGVDYAVFVYYNVHRNLRTDKNPNASHLWFEVAKTQYLSNWVSLVNNVYKSEL